VKESGQWPVICGCWTARPRDSRSNWRARLPKSAVKRSATGAKKRAAGPTNAETADAVLVAAMRNIEAEFDSTYGQPRMTRELRGSGFCVNHERVERLMRANGIAGVRKAPKVRTAILAEDNLPMPDLIGRRFAPGRRGVELLPPVESAQYMSGDYRQLVVGPKVRQSVGRTEARWDNAVAESAWSSLKRELVHRYRFATRAEARRAIFAWINRYNSRRRHSTLGYTAPIAWEQNDNAAKATPAA
jgi:putative transposase